VALAARWDRNDHSAVDAVGAEKAFVGPVAERRAFAHGSIEHLLVALEVQWAVVACCCW
jgi:hypothetical protein